METTPPDSLLDLLNRWRAGDPTALNQLLSSVRPWLRDMISRRMDGKSVNTQDSEDLTQQAIVNFLESGPRFVPRSGEDFRRLLYRIAMNELIDQARKSEHRNGKRALTLFGSSEAMADFGGAAPSSERPSRVAATSEEWNWLRLALQFLDPDDRHLLIASEVEGRSWASIAAGHGLPTPDAARVRAARLQPRLANIVRQLKSGMLPARDSTGSGP